MSKLMSRAATVMAVAGVAAILVAGPARTAGQLVDADTLRGRTGVACDAEGKARRNAYVATCKNDPRAGKLPLWAIGKVSNSDKLDGKDATQFAASTHTHAGSDITSGVVQEGVVDSSIARDNEVFGIVTSGDGTGSGLDADLLDGHHASGLIWVGGQNRNTIGTDMPDCDPGLDYLPITFNAPEAGFALVTASYTAYYKSQPSEVYAIIERTDPSYISGMKMTASVEGQGDADIVTTTQVFPVAAGFNGFVLKVCDTDDTGGSNANRGQITVIYSPFGVAS